MTRPAVQMIGWGRSETTSHGRKTGAAAISITAPDRCSTYQGEAQASTRFPAQITTREPNSLPAE